MHLTNYYKSQDALVKHLHVQWGEIDKLPFFRYQIALQNIEEMIKDEKAQQEAENRKQEATQRSEQSRYSSMMRPSSSGMPRI